MDKAIGFSLVYDTEPPRPSWLDTYPWLVEKVIEREGWAVRLWGHGDLDAVIDGDRIVVGLEEGEEPLSSRSVVIELGNPPEIHSDFGGYLPVFVGKGAASTDEGCIPGVRTLDLKGVLSFLLTNTLLDGCTIWKDVCWLLGNHSLYGTIWPQESIRLYNSDPAEMGDMLERTIRKYTDGLGDVYLSMSGGFDSRLIMLNMERKERIHARTYPISHPVSRSNEYVLAACSAHLAELADHKAVSAWNYGKYLPQYFDFYGATMSPLNAYIFAFIMRTLKERWPVLHGMPGDTLSGNPMVGNLKYVARRFEDEGRFEQTCRTDPHSWNREDLDKLFTVGWREALADLRQTWAHTWCTTEGERLSQKADLIRLRNRSAMMTIRTFSICDVYGGMVSPYCDREYTEYMLSLPDEARLKRAEQIAMAKKRWPDHFPIPRPLRPKDWDTTNTIDRDNISEEALWPIDALDHPWFNRDYVDELKDKALGGDVRSFHLLFALQTIAYGLMRGG